MAPYKHDYCHNACHLRARRADVTPWNLHMKTVVVFLAAEGRIILRLNTSQPISTSFTNSNDNTAKTTQRCAYLTVINRRLSVSLQNNDCMLQSVNDTNVYSEGECDQLNLAHIARNKNIRKNKLKQTNSIVHLVQHRFKIREGSPEGIRMTMKGRICERDVFKSGVKGAVSDRWWERRWRLWWGDMRRMRWTTRRVNTMRLTEWRRELIPRVRI